MRLSQFHEAVGGVFGSAQGAVLVRELALTSMNSRTAERALADGENPRDVWHALCDQMNASDEQRAGADTRRILPPRR